MEEQKKAKEADKEKKTGNEKKELVCPKCGSKAIQPSSSPNGYRYECADCLWTF